MTAGETSGIFLTREVRWFFDGPCPPEILAWFRSRFGDEVAEEHRVDDYDLAALQRGIGRKRRSGGTVDVKLLRSALGTVELAPDIVGVVEDWVKGIEMSGVDVFDGADHVTVDKRILSIRRDLPVSELGAGCDIEIADITVAGDRAWSLCLETYGDPDHRDAALAHGVSVLEAGTMPSALALTGSASKGYPSWLLLSQGSSEVPPEATGWNARTAH